MPRDSLVAAVVRSCLWRGDTGSVRDFAYSRIQSYAALRTERFHFTMESRSGVPCELFDMQEDPNELNSLPTLRAEELLVN